jgi:2-keto-4-pentenoate hydratase/2-oxohepta-3-ene-1,7-dioic acid hydratase in catechol pathway
VPYSLLTGLQDTTLCKGTVILTGTPSGIGHSHKPPRYLTAGIDLHVGISPLLGTLVNPVMSQGSSQSRL